MIVAYALLVQGYAVWKLRRSIAGTRVWPFILGSAIGIPAGAFLLRWLSSGQFKSSVAVLLIVFSLYNLVRPKMPSMAWAGRAGDGIVGVLNGALGAATGLAGIVVLIWSSMRGWKPDEQRAVFQPTGVATFLMCLLAFGGTGIITSEIVRLLVLGLPCLLLGTIAGWSLYGKLNEAAFRKVVHWLLLSSGIALIATAH